MAERHLPCRLRRGRGNDGGGAVVQRGADGGGGPEDVDDEHRAPGEVLARQVGRGQRDFDRQLFRLEEVRLALEEAGIHVASDEAG